MYGLIGKITSTTGQRATLAGILLRGTGDMPGCLQYTIAEDATDPDVLWISEVWTSAEAHAASLKLPAVQAAIGEGRPLIAGMERIAATQPLSREA
ncbi:MAG: quinol monooxygenase YgiN [Myxococcota bacterium]|jgi:quinol monooxygenase YgiN